MQNMGPDALYINLCNRHLRMSDFSGSLTCLSIYNADGIHMNLICLQSWPPDITRDPMLPLPMIDWISAVATRCWHRWETQMNEFEQAWSPVLATRCH